MIMDEEELLQRLASKSVQQGDQVRILINGPNDELLQHVGHIGQAALPSLQEFG